MSSYLFGLLYQVFIIPLLSIVMLSGVPSNTVEDIGTFAFQGYIICGSYQTEIILMLYLLHTGA